MGHGLKSAEFLMASRMADAAGGDADALFDLGVATLVVGCAVGLLVLAVTPAGEAFPAQLAGVLAAFAGMGAGSLAPQWLADVRTPHRLLAVDPA